MENQKEEKRQTVWWALWSDKNYMYWFLPWFLAQSSWSLCTFLSDGSTSLISYSHIWSSTHPWHKTPETVVIFSLLRTLGAFLVLPFVCDPVPDKRHLNPCKLLSDQNTRSIFCSGEVTLGRLLDGDWSWERPTTIRSSEFSAPPLIIQRGERGWKWD